MLPCDTLQDGKHKKKAVCCRLLRQTAFVFQGSGYAHININCKAILSGREPDFAVISFHNIMEGVQTEPVEGFVFLGCGNEIVMDDYFLTDRIGDRQKQETAAAIAVNGNGLVRLGVELLACFDCVVQGVS